MADCSCKDARRNDTICSAVHTYLKTLNFIWRPMSDVPRHAMHLFYLTFERCCINLTQPLHFISLSSVLLINIKFHSSQRNFSPSRLTSYTHSSSSSSSISSFIGKWPFKNVPICSAVPMPLLIAIGTPSTNSTNVGNLRNVISCFLSIFMNCCEFSVSLASHLQKKRSFEYPGSTDCKDRSMSLQGPQFET